MLRNKAQVGTALLEIVIAMALSLWLLSGLLLIYSSNQRAGQTIRAMALIQENARTATYLLSQAIRNAGYCGCLPLAERELIQGDLNTGKFTFKQATRIEAWHQGMSSALLKLPIAIQRVAKLQSDVLLVQQMVPDFKSVTLSNPYTLNSLEKLTYKSGDNLILADCKYAAILRVKAVSGNNITVDSSLPKISSRSGQLGLWSSTFYYVRDTKRTNALGQPIMALYRRDLQRPDTIAQEIIEGVEQMQIKFGLAQNHKIIYKLIPQMQRADWASILTVQINLILNSVEPVITQYSADKLLRRDWSMTIALRQPVVGALE